MCNLSLLIQRPLALRTRVHHGPRYGVQFSPDYTMACASSFSIAAHAQSNPHSADKIFDTCMVAAKILFIPDPVSLSWYQKSALASRGIGPPGPGRGVHPCAIATTLCSWSMNVGIAGCGRSCQALRSVHAPGAQARQHRRIT